MSVPAKKVLHVITGPTAVGKTELALQWAERNNAEIVSCDSLLFYRGMDIGTAKPTPAERARVPHHLIDVRPVRERMDITQYVALARAAVDGILARGRQVMVTGGSGFYLKAFFGPVADDVSVPESIRAEVNAQLESEGLPALVKRLRLLNPDGIGNLDTANPRRVTRALERCLASGRTLTALAEEFARKPGAFADFTPLLIQLDRGASALGVRIEARIEAMLKDGLIEEVTRLRAEGLEENSSAAGAIGYRETLQLLEGKLPREQLVAEIAKNTRALVKKQRTWFRTQLPPHRIVDAETATPEMLFEDEA